MRNNCKHYDTCSAPLCPKDTQSLECGLWYADEEICRLRDGPAWVTRQRKLQKKVGKDYTIGFFTKEMLDRNIRITARIKGLDPEKEMETQLKRWLRAHPGMKALTEEEKDRARTRLKGGPNRALNV